MTIDNYTVGLRVLDIEHGFRETRPDGLVQTELGTSLLMGKALNLALHIRGFNVIKDYKGLSYAAAELGVNSTELPAVLAELQEIEWVRLVGSGRSIKRVEVLVPELRDGFEVVGQRWRDLSPTELEEASVLALAEAVIRPYSQITLNSELGLSKALSETVLEVGEAGTFLRVYRLDTGERIVYSPLYGDSNPEKAVELVKKYGDQRVRTLIESVRNQQGLPVERLKGDAFVREAIRSGLVMAPAVKDKQFAFTPQQGLLPEETIILDKARAIVSCVRYGQNYAEITKIFSPKAIVDALISRKRLNPHSEHLQQYGLLTKKGIGRVDKVPGDKWQFTIADTADNMKALQVAKDLLETGDAVSQNVDDAAQAKILNPSASYSTPVSQRVRINREAKTKTADAATNKAISELIRGAAGD